MIKELRASLDLVIVDWKWMQMVDGDEGAEWAEKFEKDFYHFIDIFEGWFERLEPKPLVLEEAESHPFVVEIQEMLPGPLQLNFLTELERIVDGETTEWFD